MVMPFDSSSTSTYAQHVNAQPHRVRLPPVTTLLAVSNDGERNNSMSTGDPQRSYYQNYNTRPDGFIDLTADSSPPQPSHFRDSSFSDSEFVSFLQAESTPPINTSSSNPMPQRQASIGQRAARKRRRLNSNNSSQGRPALLHQQSHRPQNSSHYITLDTPPSEDDDEVLDLTEINGTEALHKAQEQERKQRRALQEQQNQLVGESVQAQEPDNKGPFKLGQLQCVICMDNMTDMTATHCGR